MHYPNGESYEGEWSNDKREGKGIYRWSNGDVYDGEMHENVRTGKVRFSRRYRNWRREC